MDTDACTDCGATIADGEGVFYRESDCLYCEPCDTKARAEAEADAMIDYVAPAERDFKSEEYERVVDAADRERDRRKNG